MKPANVKFERLDQLITALSDGTATTVEKMELADLLRGDPAAQAHYLDAMTLDAMLQWEYAGALVDLEPELPRGEAAAAGGGKGKVLRWPHLVLAAAAALAVGFLAAISMKPTAGQTSIAADPPPSTPSAADAATLVSGKGAWLFNDGGRRRRNLSAEQHTLRNGVAELRLANEVATIVEAPTVFELRQSGEVQLNAGRMWFRVPPQAVGFTVHTPLVSITDLGTEFAVSTDDFGTVLVRVYVGTVRVGSNSVMVEAMAPQLITAGEAYRFAERNGRVNTQRVNAADVEFLTRVPGRLVSYTAKMDADGHAESLESVTVTRGDRPFSYDAGEFIAAMPIHFRGDGAESWQRLNLLVPMGQEPGDDPVATLGGNLLFNAGLVNPGGSVAPLTQSPMLGDGMTPNSETTPGMAVRFAVPVINRPGPDVLLFDVQTQSNPPEGDHFHVSPLVFHPGLRSHSIHYYDIDMESEQALRVAPFRRVVFDAAVENIADLANIGDVDSALSKTNFRAVGVGIDLSDLGYPPDAAVDGLFFQDDSDDACGVDPVVIIGLP